MTSPIAWLEALGDGALVDGLCFALMHSIWQVALVAAVYAIGRRGLGARGRYRLGTVLLLALPIVAVATGIFHDRAASSGLDWLGNFSEPFDRTPFISEPPATSTRSASWLWPSWASALVAGCWLVGVAVLFSRMLGGVWLLHRTARSSLALPPAWERRAEALARSIGVVPVVRFVQSSMADVPFTFGFVSPVVVVPMAALTGLSPAMLTLLLRHELTHIHRGDYIVALAASTAEALMFHHPLTWWLSACVRRDRELACDESVLDQGVDRIRYAQALVNLETVRNSLPSPAQGAASGDLLMRIRAILNPNARLNAAGWWSFAALVPIVAAVLVACATEAAAPAANETTSPPVLEAHEGTLDVIWLPSKVARHAALIEETSRERDLDPNLIGLMVLAESAGDPTAVSPTGALGLMQLMPATARDVAARTGIVFETDDDLFDPRLNLQLGTALVSELLARYGNVNHALAAYNAGSRALQRHLEEGLPLRDETERYVDLLSQLYDDRDSASSDAYDAWLERLAQREG